MPSHAPLNPDFLVQDEQDLRASFGATHDLAARKSLDRIDRHARGFIERAPFLCIGTQSADGTADVSPRGDPRGFVKVLGDRLLLIPDRPGNNRLDTLSNILANPAVGLLFLIPGFDDTMRVNGRAVLTRDPDLLAPMAVKGRAPTLAIAVQVEEVFIHCAKALRRARLWDPDALQDRRDLPSLMAIILDQTSGTPETEEELAELESALERGYRETMY